MQMYTGGSRRLHISWSVTISATKDESIVVLAMRRARTASLILLTVSVVDADELSKLFSFSSALERSAVAMVMVVVEVGFDVLTTKEVTVGKSR
jgi:hypothetical protein